MTSKLSPAVERVFDRLSMMRDGKFDLSWMHANPAGWGTCARPSLGGLTVTDINVGPYGVIPDHGGAHGSMAPRGSYVPPETPSIGSYDIDEKAVVWADNAGELYEEEKKIFRLCMQDEARHVGYGTLHLKYFLKRHPERVEEIHQILDQGEEAMFALGAEPQNIEPRLILAGGGVERMQEGMMRTAFLHQKQVGEYLHRLKVAGLDRSERCNIPLEFPQ